MARIRSIKPEFWTSEQVMGLNPVTRLLFIGMWNFADDFGRMPFAPGTIKAQIMPSDALTIAQVRDMIMELDSAGLIIVYSAEGRDYIQVTGWSHQKIDKPHKPKCPAPYAEESAVPAEPSPNVPRSVDEPSSLDRIGEEEKGKKETRAEPAYPADFEKFWVEYPRTPVMAKKQAFVDWKKLSEADRIAATAAVAPYKAWLAKQKDHAIVHACRFLSQRRFDGFAAAGPTTATGFVLTSKTADQLRAWLDFKEANGEDLTFIRSQIQAGRSITVPSEYPPTHKAA
jgi:hypothetical protein